MINDKRRVMIGAPAMLALASLVAAGAKLEKVKEDPDTVKVVDDVIEVEPEIETYISPKYARAERRRQEKAARKAEQYERSGHIKNIEKQRQKRGY